MRTAVFARSIVKECWRKLKNCMPGNEIRLIPAAVRKVTVKELA